MSEFCPSLDLACQLCLELKHSSKHFLFLQCWISQPRFLSSNASHSFSLHACFSFFLWPQDMTFLPVIWHGAKNFHLCNTKVHFLFQKGHQPSSEDNMAWRMAVSLDSFYSEAKTHVFFSVSHCLSILHKPKEHCEGWYSLHMEVCRCCNPSIYIISSGLAGDIVLYPGKILLHYNL